MGRNSLAKFFAVRATTIRYVDGFFFLSYPVDAEFFGRVLERVVGQLQTVDPAEDERPQPGHHSAAQLGPAAVRQLHVHPAEYRLNGVRAQRHLGRPADGHG